MLWFCFFLEEQFTYSGKSLAKFSENYTIGNRGEILHPLLQLRLTIAEKPNINVPCKSTEWPTTTFEFVGNAVEKSFITATASASPNNAI